MGIAVQGSADVLQSGLGIDCIILAGQRLVGRYRQDFLQLGDSQARLVQGVLEVLDPDQPLLLLEITRVGGGGIEIGESFRHLAVDCLREIPVAVPKVPGVEIGRLALQCLLVVCLSSVKNSLLEQVIAAIGCAYGIVARTADLEQVFQFLEARGHSILPSTSRVGNLYALVLTRFLCFRRPVISSHPGLGADSRFYGRLFATQGAE